MKRSSQLGLIAAALTVIASVMLLAMGIYLTDRVRVRSYYQREDKLARERNAATYQMLKDAEEEYKQYRKDNDRGNKEDPLANPKLDLTPRNPYGPNRPWPNQANP